MIKHKHAPAGFIAQFFTDEKLPYPGAPNQEYRGNHFMDVTGEWCPTLEEAIVSVKKRRPLEIKKLRKRLETLEAKVQEQKDWIKSLEETSETIVEEK